MPELKAEPKVYHLLLDLERAPILNVRHMFNLNVMKQWKLNDLKTVVPTLALELVSTCSQARA